MLRWPQQHSPHHFQNEHPLFFAEHTIPTATVHSHHASYTFTNMSNSNQGEYLGQILCFPTINTFRTIARAFSLIGHYSVFRGPASIEQLSPNSTRAYSRPSIKAVIDAEMMLVFTPTVDHPTSDAWYAARTSERSTRRDEAGGTVHCVISEVSKR